MSCEEGPEPIFFTNDAVENIWHFSFGKTSVIYSRLPFFLCLSLLYPTETIQNLKFLNLFLGGGVRSPRPQDLPMKCGAQWF